MAQPRKFSSKELEESNGKNGKLAYIAYQGKVYDVSESNLWHGVEHMGMHQAGKDLTEELELAPHREEVFENSKVNRRVSVATSKDYLQNAVNPVQTFNCRFCVFSA